MIERPRTHKQEIAEETANLYLANLGLEWDELRGKKVLDIGAMNAEFEHAARRRGVDVTSLDKEVIDGEYMPPTDSRFVVANATKLPFKNESFDYAVAHLSVMNYIEKGYRAEEYLRYVEDALRETCRILKSNGRFHFTDTALGDNELRRGEDDMVPEKESDAYDAWRMEREHQILEEVAKRVGFRELKFATYTGSQRARAKEEFLLTHYYIAIK